MRNIARYITRHMTKSHTFNMYGINSIQRICIIQYDTQLSYLSNNIQYVKTTYYRYITNQKYPYSFGQNMYDPSPYGKYMNLIRGVLCVSIYSENINKSKRYSYDNLTVYTTEHWRQMISEFTQQLRAIGLHLCFFKLM
jgi:hypothetical protein